VRLAAGSDNRVLTMIAGSPSWQPAGGFSNPMIAPGDLIVGGSAGAATRLAVGAAGQVLMSGATPSWQPLPPSFANPMTTAGDLIVGGASGAPTRLAAVEMGAVLTSAGVGTAPTWNLSPTIWNLVLGSGGAVGTNGYGVLAFGPSSVPTTSPVDTIQLYTQDMDGEAGSRALLIKDERSNVMELGSTAAAIQLRLEKGTLDLRLYSSGTGGVVGTYSSHAFYVVQNAVTRMNFRTDGFIELWLNGAMRTIGWGANDSGGAGYRYLRIIN
jgi:hypothetical protein